jgi:hypothetical protein
MANMVRERKETYIETFTNSGGETPVGGGIGYPIFTAVKLLLCLLSIYSITISALPHTSNMSRHLVVIPT